MFVSISDIRSNTPETILCADLYKIINSHLSYLIIDTRSSVDYINSHIISDYILNLPKEVIAPG